MIVKVNIKIVIDVYQPYVKWLVCGPSDCVIVAYS
jgi:hypothetical protein